MKSGGIQDDIQPAGRTSEYLIGYFPLFPIQHLSTYNLN